jgi:tyrosyl-tRNA synthetase
MKNFIEELRWRGMLHDMVPGTEEMLNAGSVVKAYIGFDPTADSLGVGNLVQVMTLVHFQRCGHKPIALVGGATGMVGDPSGKSQERNLLDLDTLNHNLACQRKQLEKFLDFDLGQNSAEIVNNYDWFKNFSFLEFIRDVGKHISINYMLSKDSVQNRMENGMSFTEFTYQLIQGFDFYYLFNHHGVKLQMGGSDQWGNITTGIELVRRKGGHEAFALTTHLIKKADGSKFGKSESGNIWLDSAKTSPYKFYQFWLNAADADAEQYIKIFTLKEEEEIAELILAHREKPHERLLQKALAKDVTVRVHSEHEYENAVKASEILFGNGTAEQLQSLDENTLLSVFEGVPMVKISKSVFQNSANVVDFLSVESQNAIFSSKSEAKKMIQGGGVSINKTKVADVSLKPDFQLLKDKFLIVQKGKKNYFLVEIV